MITSSFLLLTSMPLYAKNSHDIASSLHFDIPAQASVQITNPSDALLHYQCELYSFDSSQITFQSIKGNNHINEMALNEGYQVYLNIPNGRETLLTIDVFGQLNLINRGDDSVSVTCNI